MNILIAGGSGFLGSHLAQSLVRDGHAVWVLTRTPQKKTMPTDVIPLFWDGHTVGEWGEKVNEMDAVVNLSGESLNHWPWSPRQQQRFWESRIRPGQALVEAIRQARRRPSVLIQASGINHYGRWGEIATESTPPGDDFLARLTLDWEASTREVEKMGLRQVVMRLAVVLASSGGLFPIMSLPTRFLLGGRLGNGEQAVPWIHIKDAIGAMRFLLDHPTAQGPFNLVAPHAVSNAAFMRALAKTLHRPYWLPVPAILLRLVLGEMSVLILEGRHARPARLLELGYRFQFERLEEALADLWR